ncbi:hypothetical protein [Streptomyces chattanoogensis]|uniref:hypothetical protein n=1 Tax=Streptomyces chattanoogensis TaxID=66876 RepID=UPI000AF608BD|nr:hypothetical protein [Streptomyces chattanoogensis]
MYADLGDAGARYSGKVTCVLERIDGTTVRLGTFHVHNGYGSWGTRAPSTLLTAIDGSVLATAHFGAR